ncbi:NUDIX hydrolase [Flavobacterium sp. I3-2]|uniref:NUDIX hydrolase n=1 Tax=Flavobacterium sp. I3-2 TaxID=2748319 RepID=UPI0015ACA646|nr:CoA pyrophosphatase [Flavobacterium sp. I3-2]
MLFDKFLELIPKIEKEPLLSSEAHKKMAPLERLKYYENYDYSIHNPRKSAVLSLFYPKDTQTYLLLIVRSEYVGVHSAQISFPGGKMEIFDSTLQETALRETEEEVGISRDKIEIIKPFSELYIPPSNFLVSPFMGITTETIIPKIDTREVSHILELPIHDLLDNRLISNVKMTTSYANEIEVPAFIISEHIVWGATAMILSEIKQTINNVI